MEILEKLGKKASETINCVAEGTNRLATDTKLKMKINDCKSKINDIYKEIGKKIYEKYVLDGNLEIKDDISEELTKIKGFTDKIEEYEMQRLELADLRQCEACKHKIEREAKYCPQCGAKQPEDKVCEAEVVQEKQNNDETASTAESVEENVQDCVEDKNEINIEKENNN